LLEVGTGRRSPAKFGLQGVVRAQERGEPDPRDAAGWAHHEQAGVVRAEVERRPGELREVFASKIRDSP